MTGYYEYRLNEITHILSDAENKLKVMERNKTIYNDEVIQQRKLFIKKLKAEQKELLKELQVIKPATSKNTEKKTKNTTNGINEDDEK